MDIYTISEVVWENDGSIIAYDDNREVVAKLTEKGLRDLKELYDEFIFIDRRQRDPAPQIPKGPVNYTVRVVSTNDTDRKDCPDTIDGIRIKHGDRILLTNQKRPEHNGLHEVKTTDWSRKFRNIKLRQIPTEVIGTVVVVKEGVFHESAVWVLDAPNEWRLQVY